MEFCLFLFVFNVSFLVWLFGVRRASDPGTAVNNWLKRVWPHHCVYNMTLPSAHERRMDGQTDRQTNGRTDGRTDGVSVDGGGRPGPYGMWGCGYSQHRGCWARTGSVWSRWNRRSSSSSTNMEPTKINPEIKISSAKMKNAAAAVTPLPRWKIRSPGSR